MESSERFLPSEAEVDKQAEAELRDEARDVLASLDLRLQQVRTGNLDAGRAAQLLLHNAADLRIKARGVNLAALGPLTHRLEDYLISLERLEPHHINDLQTFADRIAAVLDGETVEIEAVASVVRDLPPKPTFDLAEVTVSKVEVMLVMPQRSAARVVEREFAACGYRVSTVLDPIQALELIVETRPDLVVTAMVLPRLSGVDLACALAAMPATHDIPVALLTSLEPGHADLAHLPMATGLIRRGPQFGDDLARVLERFEIT